MTSTEQAHPEPRAGHRRRATTAVVSLLLLAVLVVFGVQLFSGQGASSAPTPAASQSVAPPSPSASTTPSPDAAAALPAAAPPRELVIETAGIDVPILPLAPTEADLAAQSIVPPETLDGYWLSNFGQPGEGSDNTTYITGHSWEGRESPFNRLSTEVEVGERVTLTTDDGTIDYVVDSVTTHDKDSLKDSDIWNVVPNRLVLISCFTEDLWGKNVVITAVPVVE